MKNGESFCNLRYKRQHHTHLTHQRNVVRQTKVAQTLAQHNASTIGLQLTPRPAAEAGSRWTSDRVGQGGVGYSSSSSGGEDRGDWAGSDVGSSQFDDAGEAQEAEADDEQEDWRLTVSPPPVPVDLYVEPRRPWSPPGPGGTHPLDRAAVGGEPGAKVLTGSGGTPARSTATRRGGEPQSLTLDQAQRTVHQLQRLAQHRVASGEPSTGKFVGLETTLAQQLRGTIGAVRAVQAREDLAAPPSSLARGDKPDRPFTPRGTSSKQPKLKRQVPGSKTASSKAGSDWEDRERQLVEQASPILDTLRLREELAAMTAERDEALTTARDSAARASRSAIVDLAASSTAATAARGKVEKKLRAELTSAKKALAATRTALADSQAEVAFLRQQQQQPDVAPSELSSAKRPSASAPRPSPRPQPGSMQVAAEKTTDKETLTQDSYTASDIALFRWVRDEAADTGPVETPTAAERADGLDGGALPYGRKRDSIRHNRALETAHHVGEQQWVGGLRSLAYGENALSKQSAPVKTAGLRLETTASAVLEEWVNALDGSPPAIKPVMVHQREPQDEGDGGSETETESDDASVASDDETASIMSSIGGNAGPAALLGLVPRDGMLLKARCSVAVRSDFTLDSQHIGDLQAGAAIEALEVRRNEATGQYRVRIAVAVQQVGEGGGRPLAGESAEEVNGWVSMSSSEGTHAHFQPLG